MNLIIKSQIPGFHYWEDAPNSYDFLRHFHRHIFYITFYIPVSESRQFEFISLKSKIETAIRAHFARHTRLESYEDHVSFGKRSCEDIANDLYHLVKNKFNIECSKIAVLEDNENGTELEFH